MSGLRNLLIATTGILAVASTNGCAEREPRDDVEAEIRVEDTDGLEEAGRETGAALEQTGEAVAEGAEEAGEAIGEAGEEIGDKAEDAVDALD